MTTPSRQTASDFEGLTESSVVLSSVPVTDVVQAEQDTRLVNSMVTSANDVDRLSNYPNLRTRYDMGEITVTETLDFMAEFGFDSLEILAFYEGDTGPLLKALNSFFRVNMTESSQMTFCQLVDTASILRSKVDDVQKVIEDLQNFNLASKVNQIKQQLVDKVTSEFEAARASLEAAIIKIENLKHQGVLLQESVCRKIDKELTKCNKLLDPNREANAKSGLDSTVAQFVDNLKNITPQSLEELAYMLCKTQSVVETSIGVPVSKFTSTVNNIEQVGYQLKRTSQLVTAGAVRSGARRYSSDQINSALASHYVNVNGAPQNWPAIRRGIFAGESGGDYNALFGFSNRSGGRFSGVSLTSMTVDEAIAFSSPSGEYGSWVRSQIGVTSTPMGAYQIVGSTLRGAKAGLGLSGNELMTPELQERMGIWIYEEQGTGAWAGYRGPIYDPADGVGDMQGVPKDVTPEEVAQVTVWKHPGIGDARVAFGAGLQAGRMGEEGWTRVDIRLRVILMRIQQQWGKRLTINSGYRSPAYNASVDGASRSYHMSGLALDVSWDGSHDAQDRERFISVARSHGIGGCGSYAANQFVHIDLGPVRNWTG